MKNMEANKVLVLLLQKLVYLNMLLLPKHFISEVECYISVCKLIRSKRWIVFTQFLLQCIEKNVVVPSFWQHERFRLLLSGNCKTEMEFNLPSDYKCFLESPSQWFDIKIKSLSSLKMNLKVSFQYTVAIFFVYRRLFTMLQCGSWCGDKQPASPRKGGATVYAAAWFEK